MADVRALKVWELNALTDHIKKEQNRQRLAEREQSRRR